MIYSYGEKHPSITHHSQCWIRVRRLFDFLIHHLSLPWFSRTFIRQEVFASQELLVQCGVCVVNFEVFRKSSIDWIESLSSVDIGSNMTTITRATVRSSEKHLRYNREVPLVSQIHGTVSMLTLECFRAPLTAYMWRIELISEQLLPFQLTIRRVCLKCTKTLSSISSMWT